MVTSEIPSLSATARERSGSRDAARLREAGQVPVIVYGHGEQPVSLAVNGKQLSELLHHHAHVINLTWDGGKDTCLVKQVQRDHMGEKIVHVDFNRVNLSEKLTTELEVHLVGEAPGARAAGAILQQPHDRVLVQCRADAIPDMLHLDGSDLEEGGSKTASQIRMPEGVELAEGFEPDTVMATITIVRATAEEDEEAEAAATASEPEVIGRDEGEREAE